jgi:hypothetical protein
VDSKLLLVADWTVVKKMKTTFDKWMADPEIKEHFDKDYKNFVLSELILALIVRLTVGASTVRRF